MADTGGHCIKVAIDFGTTYSGVAWAHTSKPNEPILLQSWSGHKGGKRWDSYKVPTEIAYDPNIIPYGYTWGFDAEAKPKKIQWVKLLLAIDPDKPQGELDSWVSAVVTSDTLKQSAAHIPIGKQPVDVVADYLSALERHTRECLRQTYGEGMLKVASIEYTLTVPAKWSDKAKALTLQAAERAGLGSGGKLRLFSEPEAAAIHCLSSIKHNHLKVGDTFVVADCGGGTVDLISYKINQLKPKLLVDECAIGFGLCGSSFVNRSFADWVSKRVGIQYKMKMKDKGRRSLLKAFEDNKRDFCMSVDDDDLDLPVSGLDDDEDAGIEAGYLKMTKERMQSFMDPVVDEVVKLIQDQIRQVERLGINSCVSAILLVGGFGCSAYLRAKLEQKLRDRNGDEIPILNPENSWTAAVRGAVLWSVGGPIVSSRLVRCHYGVAYTAEFVKGSHPEKDRFYSKYEQKYMCRSLAEWFIKKGTRVPEDKEFRTTFMLKVPANNDLSSLFDVLYACEAKEAPVSVNDPSVVPVCVLRFDLSKVPRNQFEREKNSAGMDYVLVVFDLVMQIKAAMLVFSVEVNRVKCGAVVPDFTA